MLQYILIGIAVYAIIKLLTSSHTKKSTGSNPQPEGYTAGSSTQAGDSLITTEQLNKLLYAVDLFYADWVNYMLTNRAYHTNGFCINFGKRELELSEIEIYYDANLRQKILPAHLKNAGWYVGRGYSLYDVGTENYDRTYIINAVLSYLQQQHTDFITRNILRSDGYSILISEDDYTNYLMSQ